MSSLISQMVLRKRAMTTQVTIAALNFEKKVQAANLQVKHGKDGDNGRGIADVNIKGGELIVTFTDGKNKNVGKVGFEKVIIVSGGSTETQATTGGTYDGELSVNPTEKYIEAKGNTFPISTLIDDFADIRPDYEESKI